MPTPPALLLGYLLLLAGERLVELTVARRNTRRLLAAGGLEAGRGHYPAMVLFHLGVLVACAVEGVLLVGAPRPWPLAASLVALLAALLAQGLRWWAVASLGGRWTTRIVVIPGVPPVAGGPYRWLRHPNYLAVAVELLAVPLIGGAVHTALLATAGNALLMAIRVPAEARALRAAAAGAAAADLSPIRRAAARGGGP